MKNIVTLLVSVVVLGNASYVSAADLIDQLFHTTKKARKTPADYRAEANIEQILAAAVPPLGSCPPGTPDIFCGRLINNLGQSWAIVVARVDNEPIFITPYGGRLPLPRLLQGEETGFVYPQCTAPDAKSGGCRFRFVGIAYPVATNLRAPIKEFRRAPVMQQRFMRCFDVPVTVTERMRANGFRPAINPEHLKGEGIPCPHDVYPVDPDATDTDAK